MSNDPIHRNGIKVRAFFLEWADEQTDSTREPLCLNGRDLGIGKLKAPVEVSYRLPEIADSNPPALGLRWLHGAQKMFADAKSRLARAGIHNAEINPMPDGLGIAVSGSFGGASPVNNTRE